MPVANTMKTPVFALFVILLSQGYPALAEIYQSTDENGVTVFTDQPTPDAKRIDVKEPNRVPAVKPSPVQTDRTGEQVAPPQKQQIVIVSPTDQSSFYNPENITLSAQPGSPLIQGQSIQFYDNGTALGKPSGELQINSGRLDRGTHTITVSILAEDGTKVATSVPVTLYIHRTSVLN